jgi:microcystin-dependent protein
MNPVLGSLLLVPFNFVPIGWLSCNGQLLPINENQALFSLIGLAFGGDGTTNFALPNLNGAKGTTDASGAPLTWLIAIQGVYPSRG